MPKVAAISISEKKGSPGKKIDEGEFVVGLGLKGDAHQGHGDRQVSLMGQQSKAKIAALGIEGLCTVKFKENITTEDIELFTLSPGTRMYINNTILEVTQVGKECYQNCAVFASADECIMPKEVIFARVIKGGIIKKGDEIKILTAD